ncbi:MAG TPA: ABC transporter permease [Thermoanaerobaculia bacterium]|nr:ABC transporter permease [Thermoanaerobaculia bacterium]
MRKLLAIVASTAALAAVLAVVEPRFLSVYNLQNLARLIAFLGLFALGQGLVIVSGGIDLSVGAVVGLSALLVALLAGPHPLPGWSAALAGGDQIAIGWSIAIVLALMIAVGAGQGLMITRLGLQPFIVTLGGMMTLRGIAHVLTRGGTAGLGPGHEPFRGLATGTVLGVVPVPVVVLLAAAAVVHVLLHHTVLGQSLYAIGRNEEAARYSGLDVARVKRLAYTLSAGLAASAGVLYAAYLPSVQPAFGTAFELYAIAAAVLGGCSLRGGEGTVAGILAGAALMRLITNGINLVGVSTHWELAVIGVVIVAAAVLDAAVRRREGR